MNSTTCPCMHLFDRTLFSMGIIQNMNLVSHSKHISTAVLIYSVYANWQQKSFTSCFMVDFIGPLMCMPMHCQSVTEHQGSEHL